MVSASEGWSVGSGGVILHYAGGSWQSFPSPTTNGLLSVFMVSASEGWAVGDFLTGRTTYGTILRYTGGVWQTVSNVPLFPPMVSLAMASADEGWAVGLGMLRYACGRWQEVPSPTLLRVNLESVSMVSASEGWVVGNVGTILHYDGRSWQPFPSPTTDILYSVSMVSASEGWAVGTGGTILHYTATAAPTPVPATMPTRQYLPPGPGGRSPLLVSFDCIRLVIKPP